MDKNGVLLERPVFREDNDQFYVNMLSLGWRCPGSIQGACRHLERKG